MAGPWFYKSTAAAGGNGLSWATARQSFSVLTGIVAGDTIWVAEDHFNDFGAVTTTISFPGTSSNPNIIICANSAVTNPTSADWRETAIVQTTGTFNLNLAGSFFCHGITFSASVGSSAIASMNVGVGGAVTTWQYFDQCHLRNASTSASTSTRMGFGQTGNVVGTKIILNNTQLWFGNVAQSMAVTQGHLEWRNTTTPSPFSNAVPTTLITTYSQSFHIVFEGIDFFQMATGRTFFGTSSSITGKIYFNGCRFGAGVTVAAAITSPSFEIFVTNCGPSANLPFMSHNAKYIMEGSETTDITVGRATGATDGTYPFSRNFAPGALANQIKPYIGLPFVKWNDTTLADLTITIYGIQYNGATITLPTNAQVYFETHYLADPNVTPSPWMDIEHAGTKPNFQATATTWTTDTSDWTAASAERVGGRTYGGFRESIKVSNNPGRLFILETLGTTATGAAETTALAAYAAAVDGTLVTDGTAAFRAGIRFKMMQTLNAPQPQQKGPIYIYPRIANMSNYTIWLDPDIG
jgi:hypothetical protein